METKDIVREIIADQLGLSYEQAEFDITEDTRLFDVGVDSIDMYEIAISVEDELGVWLDDMDEEGILRTSLTFGEFLRYVERAERS